MEAFFLDSVDQLYKLDTFINTGLSPTIVINGNKGQEDNKNNPVRYDFVTNEPVSLYFLRRIKKTHVRMNNNSEKGILEKRYQRECLGNFYRTYSFLDLLNLVHIRELLRIGEDYYIDD